MTCAASLLTYCAQWTAGKSGKRHITGDFEMRKEIAERLDEWGMPPIPAIQFAQEMKNRQREAERGLRMRRLCRMQSYLTPRPYPKPCEFPKFFIGMHKGERCAVLRTTSGDVKLPFVSMQFREVR